MANSVRKPGDTSIRYRILGQYRDDRVKVEDTWQNTHFVMQAGKIACNPGMIQQFNGQDACIIGYIAGSQSQVEEIRH